MKLPCCDKGDLEIEEVQHQHVQCSGCQQWWCVIDMGVCYAGHPITEEEAKRTAALFKLERQMRASHLN